MIITITYKDGNVVQYLDAKDVVSYKTERFLQFSTVTVTGFNLKVKEVHNINLDQIKNYKKSFHIDDKGKQWYN